MKVKISKGDTVEVILGTARGCAEKYEVSSAKRTKMAATTPTASTCWSRRQRGHPPQRPTGRVRTPDRAHRTLKPPSISAMSC
jgi:hypothetical protein